MPAELHKLAFASPPRSWTGSDAARLASAFLASFSAATTARDAKGLSDLFLPDGGWWRDIIAFSRPSPLPLSSRLLPELGR